MVDHNITKGMLQKCTGKLHYYLYLYDHHLGRWLSFAMGAKVKPWWDLDFTAFSMIATGGTPVT